MPIELSIHAPDYTAARDYAEVTDYLRTLPDAHEEGNDFTYRDEEAGVFMVVKPFHAAPGSPGAPGPDEAGKCNLLLVRAPNDLIATTREPLAEFTFSLARRFGWQVYDAASGTHYTDEPALVRRLGGALLPPTSAGGCAGVLALCIGLAGLVLLIACR